MVTQPSCRLYFLSLLFLPQTCHAESECKKGTGRSVDIIMLKGWTGIKGQSNSKIQVVAKQRASHLAVHDDTKHLSDDTKTFTNIASEFYRLCAKDTCGFTKEICETQARLHGLTIGGNGYEFAGRKFPNLDLYYEKGCYAYYGGAFGGRAYYGYVDDEKHEVTAEDQMGVVALPKFRVPGTFKCGGEKCTAPLSKHDTSSDTCVAESEKQPLGDENAQDSYILAEGEAAQIREAFRLSTGKDNPKGVFSVNDRDDWVKYLASEVAFTKVRHTVKVEVRHGGYEATAYPIGLKPELEKILSPLVDKDSQLYLLSCKDAMNDVVFEHADIVRELNKELKLWPDNDCPGGHTPLRGGALVEGSSLGVVVAIIFALVFAGLGGYLLYQKFGAGAKGPSTAAKSESMQHQVELATKINSYQESA